MLWTSRNSAFAVLGVFAALGSAEATAIAAEAPTVTTEAPAVTAEAPGALPTSFSLTLNASGCATTDADLAAAILTRVGSAQRVDSSVADVELLAEISNSGTSSLRVKLPQGSSRREFHGTSCDEATAIIAFIAALVLDARPEERLNATELAGLPEAAPATEKPEPEPEPEPKTPPTLSLADTTNDLVTTTPAGPAASFRVSAALALETAVAPTPPLGGLVGVNVRWDRAGWLAPELRAELLVTSTATQAAQSGELRLSLMSGRFSACPLRYHSLRALQLSLCATFDAGSLHAQGSSEIDGKPSPMPWFAGGAALRADVPFSRALALEVLLGAKALAYHDNFTLDPDDALVYAVPQFSAGFGLGLGFRP